jgi:hypothetical protein
MSFRGWLADVRFYTGAGDAGFVEHIRQAAAGTQTLASQFHPLGAALAQSQSTLASPQGVWLVAAAPAFRAPLAPLIERRRAQGFKVQVIETTNLLSPEEICLSQGASLAACIHRLLQGSKGPNFVLLAGAAGAPDPLVALQTVVPSLSGSNGVMKGWPSDYGYGLPRQGTTGLCAAAVGRFPARTVEEMRGMVEKTLNAEENGRRPGAWRSRLALILGNPGAGPLGEMFVEQMVTQRLGRLHPAWNLRAVFHLPASPYYCTSAGLRRAVVDTLRAGALFSVYMGHSDARGLWSVNSSFFSRADWAGLKLGPAQGVFFSCGCFGCELGGADGYALAAMRNSTGPVAVIAASGESFSAAGLLAVDGLLRCVAQPPFRARLADYWLAVQEGLARGPIDDLTFKLLDESDGTGGKVPLAVQRLEDLEMWTLLGDPALCLPVVPVDVSLETAGPVRSGLDLVVKGTLPARLAGATVRLTLERPLDSSPAGLEPLPRDSAEDRAARERIAAANCERANQFVLAAASAVAEGDRFHGALAVPASLRWSKVVVRAVAEKGDESAEGIVVVGVSGE